ncbi:OmpW/AlkL family protein [Cypionkella sp. TWP1-2-1b2]|uniref:OmpW/AlkL family protein n=1 Tax=Cypionkella sp. TWP1-2-1b2 TaxID=2804675 RepID=UPI003CEEC02B
MKMKITLLAVVATAALAGPAAAQSAGDMTLGFGVALVSPKSDNGTLAGAAATASDSTQPSITFEYFLRDNLGLEVLAALPFKHSIYLNGGFAGETKQLPPTISLNYHFANASKFTPFVGLGLNYTKFFETSSPLGDLKIDDSFGVAVHLGADYALSDKAALRFDLRYAKIQSDVSLNGAGIGKVEIDPLVTGISYIIRF